MAAWEITRTWTTTEIEAYRDFVGKEGPNRIGNLRATCEDLALRLLIDFAAQQGLPVVFFNGAHRQGIYPDTEATIKDFERKVLSTTGASDLLDSQMAKMVKGAVAGKSDSLFRAQKGDLIILRNGGHVQVVTFVVPFHVSIVQGNFRPDSEQCGRLQRWVTDQNQNNPNSFCYIGEIVKTQSYSRNAKTSNWDYSRAGSATAFEDQNGRLATWDFEFWNGLVAKHTVAANESLSHIALKHYGNGNAWKRIHDANRTAIGPDPHSLKTGLTIYVLKPHTVLSKDILRHH